MPTPMLYLLSAIGTLAVYVGWKRYELLAQARVMITDFPAPYNDILKWYTMFNADDLPEEHREKGAKVLKLMREREVYKAAQILGAVALAIGVPAFYALRRYFIQ